MATHYVEAIKGELPSPSICAVCGPPSPRASNLAHRVGVASVRSKQCFLNAKKARLEAELSLSVPSPAPDPAKPTLPASGPPKAKAAPFVVTNLCFEGTTHDGQVVKVRVKSLALRGSWPTTPAFQRGAKYRCGDWLWLRPRTRFNVESPLMAIAHPI